MHKIKKKQEIQNLVALLREGSLGVTVAGLAPGARLQVPVVRGAAVALHAQHVREARALPRHLVAVPRASVPAVLVAVTTCREREPTAALLVRC